MARLRSRHRPLVAALAEAQLVVGYWLRSGNTGCINGAVEFLRQTLLGLPSHIAVGLVRADSGFAHQRVMEELGARGMNYVMAIRLTQPIQIACRHDDTAWEKTDMEGMETQELETLELGRRLIVIRQRIARRPEAGGKAAPGSSRVSIPSVGDQPAHERQGIGGVAPVQWESGH